MTDRFTIRVPPATWAAYLALSLVSYAVLITLLILGPDRILPAAALVLVVLVDLRLALLRVTAEPDRLLVANQWRTTVVDRADIEGFTGRREQLGRPQSGFVDLRDGTSLRMSALERRTPFGNPTSTADALARLEGWLAPRVRP